MGPRDHQQQVLNHFILDLKIIQGLTLAWLNLNKKREISVLASLWIRYEFRLLEKLIKCSNTIRQQPLAANLGGSCFLFLFSFFYFPRKWLHSGPPVLLFYQPRSGMVIKRCRSKSCLWIFGQSLWLLSFECLMIQNLLFTAAQRLVLLCCRFFAKGLAMVF